MGGFGGLVDRLDQALTMSYGGPGPEVRAWCVLHGCQMPSQKVWLFSFPSSSQDPS